MTTPTIYPIRTNLGAHIMLRCTLAFVWARSKHSNATAATSCQGPYHCPRKYPPTSLSVERVRTPHQPASPSAIQLQPLNSLSSSANQPASTPNLVAASLQGRRLAYYLLKGSTFRCESSPQVATERHSPPQDVRLSGLYTLLNLHEST